MIDYIEFQVTDIPLAKSFYKHLFNWDYVDYGTEYCEFIDKKLKGGFAKVEAKSNIDIQAGLISPLVIFVTDDLEAMYQKVIDADIEIIKEIFSFPGGRRFEFYDPFGHRLGIWSTVGFE